MEVCYLRYISTDKLRKNQKIQLQTIMKKLMMLATVAISVLALGACSGNGSCKGNGCSKSCGDSAACNTECARLCKSDGDKLFTGVLPAADADGVRYMLTLDFDDDKPCSKGDYDLVETYLVADSTAVTGYTDGKTFKSEGDFTVTKKDGTCYLTLIQDKKDSAEGSNAGPLYFKVTSDSTIVMVNSDFEISENPGLNYTLKLSR